MPNLWYHFFDTDEQAIDNMKHSFTQGWFSESDYTWGCYGGYKYRYNDMPRKMATKTRQIGLSSSRVPDTRREKGATPTFYTMYPLEAKLVKGIEAFNATFNNHKVEMVWDGWIKSVGTRYSYVHLTEECSRDAGGQHWGLFKVTHSPEVIYQAQYIVNLPIVTFIRLFQRDYEFDIRTGKLSGETLDLVKEAIDQSNHYYGRSSSLCAYQLDYDDFLALDNVEVINKLFEKPREDNNPIYGNIRLEVGWYPQVSSVFRVVRESLGKPACKVYREDEEDEDENEDE